MLLKLFKTNKPIVLSILPILGGLVVLPTFFLAPSFGLGSFFSGFLSLLIILSSSYIVNLCINQSELFNRTLFLSALTFVVFSCSVSVQDPLNPIILSNLFLVLALREILKIKRQVSCKSLLFNSSCLIIISGLLYPPYLLFFILPWCALSVIKTFYFKEWLMPIIALILFLFYGLASCLFFDLKPTQVAFFLASDFSTKELVNSVYSLFYVVLTFCFLYSLLTLFKLTSSATNRFKKLSGVVVIFSFLSALLLVFNFYTKHYLDGLLSMSASLSLVLPFALVHSSKQVLMELLLTGAYIILLIAVFLG